MAQINVDTIYNSAGTGAPSFPAGMSVTMTGLADADATKLGFKSYAHGTTYNGGNAPTITLTGGGGSLSTVYFSSFRPFQDQAGNWFMNFQFQVGISNTSRTQIQISVAGVVSDSAGNQQAIAGFADLSSNALGPASVLSNSGDFRMLFSSQTCSYFAASGTIRLNAKPNWAY